MVLFVLVLKLMTLQVTPCSGVISSALVVAFGTFLVWLVASLFPPRLVLRNLLNHLEVIISFTTSLQRKVGERYLLQVQIITALLRVLVTPAFVDWWCLAIFVQIEPFLKYAQLLSNKLSKHLREPSNRMF